MFNTLSVLANAASNATSSMMSSVNNSSSNEVDSHSSDSGNISTIITGAMFVICASAALITIPFLTVCLTNTDKKSSCCTSTPSTITQSYASFTPIPSNTDLESGSLLPHS